jgi:hypothetical protein
VLICLQHHISVFGTVFEIALLKFFKHHLIGGVLTRGATVPIVSRPGTP